MLVLSIRKRCIGLKLRCYVRNGVWGWSLEEQEKALAMADVLEPDRLYRDDLPASQARQPGRVRPEWLMARKALLRPTGRSGNDPIYVATLLALGVTEADLIDTLTAAAEHRRSAVIAIDSGITIAPDGGMQTLNEAVKDWQRAKAKARTKPGRTAGYIAAAEKKRARTLAATKIARPLWRDTKHNRLTAEQIAEQVELSAKTLYSELGRRPAVRRQRQ